MNRRTYLLTSATAATVGLAGCSALQETHGPDTGTSDVVKGETSQAHRRRWTEEGAYVEQLITVAEHTGYPDTNRYDLAVLFVAVAGGDDTDGSCLDGGAIDSFEITVAAGTDETQFRRPFLRGVAASDPDSLLERYPNAFDSRADLSDSDAVYDALDEIEPDLNQYKLVPVIRNGLEHVTLDSERSPCPVDEFATLGPLTLGLFDDRDRIGEPSRETEPTKTTHEFSTIDEAPAVAMGYTGGFKVTGNGSTPTLEVSTALSSTGFLLGSDLPADTYRHEATIEL